MKNEKLEQAAHRYADLLKQIKDADRKVSKSIDERDGLLRAAQNQVLIMKEFIGANISRRAIVTPGGMVVTVEYVSENCIPAVRVYEDGEEIP